MKKYERPGMNFENYCRHDNAKRTVKLSRRIEDKFIDYKTAKPYTKAQHNAAADLFGLCQDLLLDAAKIEDLERKYEQLKSKYGMLKADFDKLQQRQNIDNRNE